MHLKSLKKFITQEFDVKHIGCYHDQPQEFIKSQVRKILIYT